MKREHNTAHRGFTLLELLAVIAVIAILAVILVTGISGARDRAAETLGLSNLRSLALACVLASNERGGRFPVMRNYPWEEVLRPDGEEAGWMQEELAAFMGHDPDVSELPSPYRNPAVERSGRPAWLVEGAEHSHYRYNALVAPGNRPEDPGRAVVVFTTVWPDWPAGDFPFQVGGPAMGVGYADGSVVRLSKEDYLELVAGAESPESPFFRGGWQ